MHGAVEARHEIQDRGFSRTGRAQQGDKTPGVRYVSVSCLRTGISMSSRKYEWDTF